MKSRPTYIFFTWEDISYSRTGVIFSGIDSYLSKPVLRKVALNSVWLMTKEIRGFIKATKDCNPIYVIGSPCGLLVLSVRLAALKSKIVYDAGWPQVDGLMSRKNSLISRTYKFSKLYLLDLLSFHFSNLIALESHAQMERVRKRFLISKNKLFVSYTGLNEVQFKISQSRDKISNLNSQMVLFRGKFNQEAGLEILAETSWLIPDNILLIVLCPNIPKDLVFSPRTKVISERISDAEIAAYYSRAYLAIGQLGNSRRTEFTIPHKFFEAAYFRVPYLTPNTKGICELFPENNFGPFSELDDAAKIAKVIIQYAHNKNLQDSNSGVLALNYKNRFSQEVLARNFENHTRSVLKL